MFQMKQMEIYMYKEFTLIFLKEIQSLAQYKKYAKKFKRRSIFTINFKYRYSSTGVYNKMRDFET